MLTLPSLLVAIFAPILGRYIYRFGIRKSLFIGLLVFVVSGSAGYYLDGIYLLLASRMIFGLSIAILMIISTALVGNYFDIHQRAKFMSLQMAFTAIGGLFVLVLVYLNITEVSNKKNISHITIENKKIYGVYILAFIVMLLFFVLPTQFPFMLINQFHANGKLTALIISSAFVANAIGAISFRYLVKTMPFYKIYLLGLSSMAMGMYGIGQVQSVEYFFLTAPIIGFSGGLLMSNITTWMLSFTDEQNRIKASSYLTNALFLGQFSSPVFSYPLVMQLGVQSFFEMLGIGILLCVVSALIIIKQMMKMPKKV
jgi:MFS family permease